MSWSNQVFLFNFTRTCFYNNITSNLSNIYKETHCGYRECVIINLTVFVIITDRARYEGTVRLANFPTGRDVTDVTVSRLVGLIERQVSWDTK